MIVLSKETTPEEYLQYKKDTKSKWCEVPFVCKQCGVLFHINRGVNPRKLPQYHNVECKMKAFDPEIGLIISKRLRNLDWEKVKLLISIGKSGPEIAKTMKISLAALHRHVKDLFPKEVRLRMKQNGQRNRGLAMIKAWENRLAGIK